MCSPIMLIIFMRRREIVLIKLSFLRIVLKFRKCINESNSEQI